MHLSVILLCFIFIIIIKYYIQVAEKEKFAQCM